MNRSSIILAGALLVIVAGGFVVLQNTKKPAEQLSTQTVQSLPSGIVYGADGKLDTSNWQEYRSEYGGFSVRAPRAMSGMGCFNRYFCNEFNYLLTNTNILLAGLRLEIIIKNSSSTLDTWLNDYIVSGRDKLLNVQKTTIDGYPALQFDRQEEASNQDVIIIRSAAYSAYFINDNPVYEKDPNHPITPDVYEKGLVGAAGISYRFLVIDLGNRYAFVSYTLSINKQVISKAYVDPASSSFREQLFSLPNDKTLADVYAAILDSFQAFTPTKL